MGGGALVTAFGLTVVLGFITAFMTGFDFGRLTLLGLAATLRAAFDFDFGLVFATSLRFGAGLAATLRPRFAAAFFFPREGVFFERLAIERSPLP
jgi:hypothetical protein